MACTALHNYNHWPVSKELPLVPSCFSPDLGSNVEQCRAAPCPPPHLASSDDLNGWGRNGLTKHLTYTSSARLHCSDVWHMPLLGMLAKDCDSIHSMRAAWASSHSLLARLHPAAARPLGPTPLTPSQLPTQSVLPTESPLDGAARTPSLCLPSFWGPIYPPGTSVRTGRRIPSASGSLSTLAGPVT